MLGSILGLTIVGFIATAASYYLLIKDRTHRSAGSRMTVVRAQVLPATGVGAAGGHGGSVS